MTLRNIFWFFLFTALAFGQWGRLSFLNQEINVYVFELLVGGYVVWNIRGLSFLRSYIIFISTLLMSLVWGWWNFNGIQNFVGVMYVGRVLLYGMFAYILSQSEEDILFLKRWFWVYVVLILLGGIIQIVFLSNFAPSLYFLGWDNHLARVVGFFFDSTTAGVIYGMVFLYVVPRLTGDPGISLKILGLLSFLLFFGTFSRISYIGMLSVLVYALFQKDWKSLHNVGLLSFLSLLILLSVYVSRNPLGEGMRLLRTSTISARYESVNQGIEMWKSHPIVGVGYGRIRYVKNVSDTDKKIEAQRGSSHGGNAFPSSYVTILASSGIIGLFALLYFLKDLWNVANSHQKYLLVFILITSLFDNVMLVNFVMINAILMWSVLEIRN